MVMKLCKHSNFFDAYLETSALKEETEWNEILSHFFSTVSEVRCARPPMNWDTSSHSSTTRKTLVGKYGMLASSKAKQNKTKMSKQTKSLLLTSGRMTQLRNKQAYRTKFKALVSNENILAWLDLLPHSMNGWMGLDLPTELKDKLFLVVFLQSKSTGMLLKRITMWAGKIVQPVNVLATKVEDPSLIPGTYMVER